MTTLIDEFSRQVAEAGGRLALQDGERALTFLELNRAANRIAHALLERRGVHQEPVGVLLGHSAEAIVALLAVTKAGQIRLPLDPQAPPSRLREILEHAGARTVLTDRIHGLALAGIGGVELLDLGQLPGTARDDDVVVALPEDALFALVYTSGSTGRPKAVVIGHRDASALVGAFDDSVALRSNDRTALTTGLSFSAARGADRALLRGASVHVFDLRTLGPERLAHWLARERITYLVAFSSTLRALLDELALGASLPDLRLLLVSGEPLYRADVERVRTRIGSGCELLYGYATAEVGGFSTLLRIAAETDLRDEALPAGRPLPNVDLTLANVGDDGVGEIVVRSRYVTIGYWRQPELTAARFSADASDPGLRTFHTSDLGRLRPDGTLELVGRSDARVKIRGYSVDPSEVELALSGLEEVDRAAVVKGGAGREGGRLVAYYVPAAARPPTVTALRRGLLEKLPPYMIPATFVPVEAIPLTGSGKVDRLALPPPPTTRPALEEPYEEPRDDVESALVAIWEQVLDVRPIGIQDNFYALGGDSLAATEAKIAIGEQLGEELPLVLFAEATATVASLAQALRTRETAAFAPVVPLQPEGSAPPFFCVHGAGGEILELSALAPLLAPEHPFYGLQLIGNKGDRAVRSVPALARHYIELIRAVRPEGSYIVGGYSGGGAVAYEMAQQLAAAKTPPAAVVLLDAPAPTVLAHPEVVAQRTPSPREKRWRKRLLRIVLDLHILSRTTIPPRWRELHRTTAGNRALFTYDPAPYHGPLHLLQTGTLNLPHGLGWDTTTSDLRIIEIPGGHHSMLMPPHVSTLAETLRTVLSTDAGNVGT